MLNLHGNLNARQKALYSKVSSCTENLGYLWHFRWPPASGKFCNPSKHSSGIGDHPIRNATPDFSLSRYFWGTSSECWLDMMFPSVSRAPLRKSWISLTEIHCYLLDIITSISINIYFVGNFQFELRQIIDGIV